MPGSTRILRAAARHADSTPVTAATLLRDEEDTGDSTTSREDGSARRASWLRRTAVAAAFLALFGIYFSSPVWSRSDPLWVPYTAQRLLDHQDLDLSARGFRVGDDYALVEQDGQVVSYFPWTTAALTTPLVVLHRMIEPFGIVTPLEVQLQDHDVGQFQRFAGGLFAAAAAMVLALLTRRLLRLADRRGEDGDGDVEVDSDPIIADRWWFVPLCTFVFGLGTSLWSTASRGLWQHGPGILVLGGAWLAALHDPSPVDAGNDSALRRFPVITSGVLAGLAFGVRPTNVVPVIALGAFLAWRRRETLMTWVISLLGVVVAVIGANVVLLGSPLPSYFSADRAGFHPEYVRAVIDDVLSPSRGLVVFSPWLVLAVLTLLPARRRMLGGDVVAFAWTALAGCVGSLLVAASYGEHWWAGHSYGPRFLSETVVVLGPLALLAVFGPRPATTAARRLSTVVAPILIVVSMLMHAPGALTEVTECWSRSPVDVDTSPARVEDWSDPQFVAGWVTLVSDGPAAPISVCQARRS